MLPWTAVSIDRHTTGARLHTLSYRPSVRRVIRDKIFPSMLTSAEVEFVASELSPLAIELFDWRRTQPVRSINGKIEYKIIGSLLLVLAPLMTRITAVAVPFISAGLIPFRSVLEKKIQSWWSISICHIGDCKWRMESSSSAMIFGEGIKMV